MSGCCVVGALLLGFIFRAYARLFSNDNNKDWVRPTRETD